MNNGLVIIENNSKFSMRGQVSNYGVFYDEMQFKRAYNNSIP